MLALAACVAYLRACCTQPRPYSHTHACCMQLHSLGTLFRAQCAWRGGRMYAQSKAATAPLSICLAPARCAHVLYAARAVDCQAQRACEGRCRQEGAVCDARDVHHHLRAQHTQLTVCRYALT